MTHLVQFAHGVLVKADDHSQRVNEAHADYSPDESVHVNPLADAVESTPVGATSDNPNPDPAAKPESGETAPAAKTTAKK